MSSVKAGWCRIVLLLVALGLVAACGDPASRPGPEAAASPQSTRSIGFTDVTAEAGLGGFRHENGAFGERWFPETMGAGGGFLDYDGDGWLDVLLVGGGRWPGHGEPVQALRLYRNEGVPDGAGRAPTFTEVTAEVGLGGLTAYGMGIAAADYDNDGDTDIYFTTIGANMLFRNDPDPSGQGRRFTEVAGPAGVAGEDVWSSAAIFFDADRDGHLDLYVGNYADWSAEDDVWCTVDGREKSYCAPTVYDGVSSRFYHNDGDGTFTDWSERAGFLPSPGKTLGVAELDFDRDGWPDLAVANDMQPDELYRNRGDGTFDEVGVESGIAFDENGIARGGMGIDVGVVDTTGQPTIFVGNFANEMIGVYRHLGNGLFIDRAASSRIGQPSLMRLTFGLFLFDAELDGDLDLFVANGHVFDHVDRTRDGVSFRQPAQLFVNRGRGVGGGEGRFDERGAELGGVFATEMVGRGAAYADYDRDGDLDVLVTENAGPVHLWRNDRPAGRSLRVHLEGRRSNRDGLGARVVAVVDGHAMERRVRTGSSYLSQMEQAVTFGLGSAAEVDSLVVFWPSGTVDRFARVPAGVDVHVVEGSGTYERRARAGDPPQAGPTAAL